jgi:molybdopterin synthase catalytic subunit
VKVRIAAISDQPLQLEAHGLAVRDPAAGAEASFCGVVRDHDHGRSVLELEYSGHPTAARVLREVAEEIAADPAVIAVAVSHRIGPLRVGDVALVANVWSTRPRPGCRSGSGRCSPTAPMNG